MAYTLDFAISLGSSKTGLTLNAQIVDTSGGDIGSAITTGFTEVGTGTYLLHCATIPDAHRGGIKFYESGVPATILALGSINPEEAEYIDDILADTSAMGTSVTVVSPSVVTDNEWTFYTHDTVEQPVTDLGDITGYKAVWVTIKNKDTDVDSKAILLFSDDVGLEVLQGNNDVTAGDAAVTIDDASAGNITMKLETGATSRLGPSTELVWGIKWKDADDEVHTLLDGQSDILAGPVKATS